MMMMMMKKNSTLKIFKITIFLVVIVNIGSCTTAKNYFGPQINKKLNDSLNICISFDKETKEISLISLFNSHTGISKAIEFSKDGASISSFYNFKDRYNENDVSICSILNDIYRFRENGVSYRYYSSGRLKFKVNFKNGKYDGLYEYYSSEGELLYKAIYENGIEKEVIIGTLYDEIEIVEIED
jgi:antitoxin component YwqK of YwqJK toxin-antitoxin module